MLELGALLGALLAGAFADRYSRRQSIFAACGTSLHLTTVHFPMMLEGIWGINDAEIYLSYLRVNGFGRLSRSV